MHFDYRLFFARVVSIFFSPVILALVYLYFIYSKYLVYGIELSMMITIYLLLLLPAYFIKLIKRYPFLKFGEDPNRYDRVILYFAIIIASFFNILLFGVNANFNHIFTLNIIMFLFWGLFFIFNFMIDKISVHTGWFTFVFIAIGGTYPISFILSIFLPLLAWSRFTLHKHTWFQMLFGITIGGFVGVLAWLV